MPKIDNSGPAFPARPQERLAGGDIIAGNEGMSLRDYAAIAIAAEIAGGFAASDRGITNVEAFAASAHQLADALIAESKKGEPA